MNFSSFKQKQEAFLLNLRNEFEGILKVEFDKLFEENPTLKSFALHIDPNSYNDEDYEFQANVDYPDINDIKGYELDCLDGTARYYRGQGKIKEAEEEEARIKDLLPSMELQKKVASVLRQIDTSVLEMLFGQGEENVVIQVTKDKIEFL